VLLAFCFGEHQLFHQIQVIPLLIYFVIREGMFFLQGEAGASEGRVISESVSFSRGRVIIFSTIF